MLAQLANGSLASVADEKKVLSLMLMLGVLNTSHVDLRGNTFHVHLGGVKYLSC